MLPLRIEIPVLPPGINATYKTTSKGKRRLYKSAEANAWSAGAASIIGSMAGVEDWHDNSDYYEVTLTLGDLRKDIDASIKIILDTLSQKLGFDDKRILRVVLEKCLDCEEGIVIEIEPYQKRPTQ